MSVDIRSSTPLRLAAQNPASQQGLLVDQAALAWLRQQPQLKAATACPSIHPLVFVRLLLQQIHCNVNVSMKHLMRESFTHRAVPSQHINDHHFSRSLKYLGSQFGLELADSGSKANPGDIVVFTRAGYYMQTIWAVRGSAGRLYHVDSEQQRIVCSFIQFEHNLRHIIRIHPPSCNPN